MSLNHVYNWFILLLSIPVGIYGQQAAPPNGLIAITCADDVLVVVPQDACNIFLAITPPDVQAELNFTVANNYTNSDDASGIYNVGPTTITWVATDVSGSSVSCNQLVTVADTQAPTITCPVSVDIMLEDEECGRNLTINPPLVSDNCPTLFLTNDYNASNNISGYFPAGIIHINWEVLDGFGNAASCMQEISLLESIPPTISCPPNLTVTTEPGLCEAFVNVPPAVPMDNCPEGLTYSNSLNGQTNASGTFTLGTTFISWTTSDASGNTATCQHTVTIIDEEAPLINCPDTIFAIAAPGSCEVFIDTDTPTGTDNCSPIVSFTNNFNNSNNADGVYPVEKTTVIWNATDAAGNSTTCEQIVIVEDKEAPIITCNITTDQLDALGDCQATIPDYLNQVQVSDNCSTINNITLTQTPAPFTIINAGNATVSITATDEYGNSNNCTISLVATDALPPVISCPLLPDTLTISSGCEVATPDYSSSITAEDECTITSNLQILQSPAPDSLLSFGTHTIEMTVIDEVGLQNTCVITLVVSDTLPPVADCNLPIDTFFLNSVCETNLLDYTSETIFTDNCGDQNITLSQSPLAGTIIGLGNHIITIQATDLSGNSTTCEKNIILLDTLPPTITCPTDLTINALPLSCDAFVQLISPIAIDSCAGVEISNNLTGTILGEILLGAGANFIEWTATDDFGNQTICRQSITIIPDLDISANLVANPTCENGFAQLQAPDFPGATYLWTGPDNFNSSTQNPQLNDLTTNMAGSYEVLIDNNGCAYFGTVTLAVMPPPAITIQGDQIICTGEQLSLDVEAALSGSIESFQWETPEGDIFTTPELNLSNIAPSGTGIYSLQTTGSGGCFSSAEIEVIVFDFPMAEDDLIPYNKEATLTFNVLQNDYYNVDGDYTLNIITTPLQGELIDEGSGNYQYIPGNNFDGTEQFIYEFCYEHCFGFCTMATVSFEAITDTETCNIPNLITPNDDGYNDVFLISCLENNDNPQNHLMIFNEWGDKVFEAQPYTNNWDGTYKNKALPDGTYFYFFRKDVAEEVTQGHISLYK